MREQRGLLVGFGIVFVAAAMTATLGAGDRYQQRPVDIFVGSAADAVVPRPDPDEPFPLPCNATPSTGRLEVEITHRGRREELMLPLCHPPAYNPGAASLSFAEPGGGISVHIVLPAGGWESGQKWRGLDASVGVTDGDKTWSAWDDKLPCDIDDVVLRRYLAGIVAYHGDPAPDSSVLIGASAEGSFRCTGLPRSKGKGETIDLRGRLSVRNCEGRRDVVPPPVISARCDGYERMDRVTNSAAE